MLGVICSTPEFRGCRAAIILEHLVFWHHTVHYRCIMFGTIGLKISMATLLCAIQRTVTAELYTIHLTKVTEKLQERHPRICLLLYDISS